MIGRWDPQLINGLLERPRHTCCALAGGGLNVAFVPRLVFQHPGREWKEVSLVGSGGGGRIHDTGPRARAGGRGVSFYGEGEVGGSTPPPQKKKTPLVLSVCFQCVLDRWRIQPAAIRNAWLYVNGILGN